MCCARPQDDVLLKGRLELDVSRLLQEGVVVWRDTLVPVSGASEAAGAAACSSHLGEQLEASAGPAAEVCLPAAGGLPHMRWPVHSKPVVRALRARLPMRRYVLMSACGLVAALPHTGGRARPSLRACHV